MVPPAVDSSSYLNKCKQDNPLQTCPVAHFPSDSNFCQFDNTNKDTNHVQSIRFGMTFWIDTSTASNNSLSGVNAQMTLIIYKYSTNIFSAKDFLAWIQHDRKAACCTWSYEDTGDKGPIIKELSKTL